MIPSFLKATEAEKIMLIGKSINFLREVCHQPLSDFTMPNEAAEDTQCSNLNAVIISYIEGM